MYTYELFFGNFRRHQRYCDQHKFTRWTSKIHLQRWRHQAGCQMVNRNIFTRWMSMFTLICDGIGPFRVFPSLSRIPNEKLLTFSWSCPHPLQLPRQRRGKDAIAGELKNWIMWSCHDWTCCIQELALFPFDIRVVWALCGYPWLLYYGLSCTFNPLPDLLGGFSIDRRGAGSKKNHDGFTDL